VFYRVKYSPSDAMRQSYWRSKLNGQLSHTRLLEALKVAGLLVSTEHVNEFFKKSNKDPKNDELTIEEAIIFLEKCVMATQVKAEEGHVVAAEVAKAEPETDKGVGDDLGAPTGDAFLATGPVADAAAASDAVTYVSRIKSGEDAAVTPRVTKDELRTEKGIGDDPHTTVGDASSPSHGRPQTTHHSPWESVMDSYKVPSKTPTGASEFDAQAPSPLLDATGPPSSPKPTSLPASRGRGIRMSNIGSTTHAAGEVST
jgi:hypothetical protein